MCPTERARGPFARPPRLPPRARGTWGPSRPPATLCPTEGRPGFAGPSPSAGPGAPVEAPVALRPHKGAARLRRAVSERGAWGARPRPPVALHPHEGRPGFAGAVSERGDLGRPSRPPVALHPHEGRPGFSGPSPSARPGAPVAAPGRVTPPRGAARLRRAVSERGGAWGAPVRGPRSRYAPTRGGPASPGRLRARGAWGAPVRGPRSRYAPTRGGPASPGRLRARGAWGALLGPPLLRSSKPRNESSMRARDSR